MWYLITYHFIFLQQLPLPIQWTQLNYIFQIWILGGSILHAVATVGTEGGGRGGREYKCEDRIDIDDGSGDGYRDNNGGGYKHGERDTTLTAIVPPSLLHWKSVLELIQAAFQ